MSVPKKERTQELRSWAWTYYKPDTDRKKQRYSLFRLTVKMYSLSTTELIKQVYETTPIGTNMPFLEIILKPQK